MLSYDDQVASAMRCGLDIKRCLLYEVWGQRERDHMIAHMMTCLKMLEQMLALEVPI